MPVAPGVWLSTREWEGGGPAFVLLHGLASNARLWDGVARLLADAGHRVVAVDQRGHGRSSKPETGFDLTTVTDDLRAVVDVLELEAPILVGQSWGANVVVEFGARFPHVASAIGCIDGGAIQLQREYPHWDACAEALRPPAIAGARLEDVEAMIRATHPDWPESGIQGTLACFEVRPDNTVAPHLDLHRHLAVLRGLWDHEPMTRYPHVTEKVLFIAAERAGSERDPGYEEAIGLLSDGHVEWLVGDHDLHAQHPARVADLLRTLAPSPARNRLELG